MYYSICLEVYFYSQFRIRVLERTLIGAYQACNFIFVEGKDLSAQKEILLILAHEDGNSDLHCFSCVDCWSKDIADDINSAIQDSNRKKSSKQSYVRPGTLSRQRQRREIEGATFEIIPPPPAVPPPSVPVSNSVKKRLDHIRKTAYFQKPQDETFGNDAADYNSLFAYRVDRNVQVLNHCLDDVEAFASRIQKAAEAAKELSNRKSKRVSNGSIRSTGERLYTLRSKPPSRSDYLEIFAQLKFAFILLGELQGHISNPSAGELMHFLFRPLHLIVQSCRGPHLAQTVLTPLHSEKCLKLLRETMTSSEAELFFSFGEKWTKSRESWPNQIEIVDYSPRFRSGWIPPPIQPPPNEHPTVIDPETYSPIEPADILQAKVLRDFVARNEMELTVQADDLVDILDDTRKWWHCRNEYNQRGYVPSNLLMKLVKDFTRKNR